MKLIVGLGNPGLFYINSRHNIGFRVIKSLAKSLKAALKKDKYALALSAKTKIAGETVILAEPLTFMNLSGGALKQLLDKYEIGLGDLLVIADDLDLGFGRMRIRSAGSSAGQRGVQNIIDVLGTNEFARLRIGVGRPGGRGLPSDRPRSKYDASRYVLSSFNRREKEGLKGIIDMAEDCCRVWASEGIDEAMNIFNRSLPAGRQGVN